MVIGIKWFHFIVSFLRDGPSFFRTTSAGKWFRAFGDPLSGLIFSQGSVSVCLLSVLNAGHLHWKVVPLYPLAVPSLRAWSVASLATSSAFPSPKRAGKRHGA